MRLPLGTSDDYFDYLLQRSRLAWFYRKYWLYPRLCRHLKGRVLDIGCGIGDFLSFRSGTVGTDINPQVINWCQAKGHNAVLMESTVIPFEDNVFTGVLLDNVLEHIPDPVRILSEIRRVLCLGGQLVVGVPGRKGYDSDPDHRIFYDDTTLLSTIQMAGFSSRTLFYMPFKSAYLDRHMRQYAVYGVFSRD